MSDSGPVEDYDQKVEQEQELVAQFNMDCPIGSPVRYWTWVREGDGQTSKTKSVAQMMCDHAVVWIEDHAACIALSHIQPIPTV